MRPNLKFPADMVTFAVEIKTFNFCVVLPAETCDSVNDYPMAKSYYWVTS